MAREGDVDESKRATLRRFAALGATSPLVGLARDSESDAPDALLGYVAATPGAHFSKVRDDLQLGTGETQHHLRRLEREGAVESREDGEYRRFFPADRFSEFEQVALGYLRRETPRGMVVALLRDPDASGLTVPAGAERVTGTYLRIDRAGDAPAVIYRDKATNDHLLLLSEGRLVNLGNATGHPSRIMDGSFANQVLAQMHLFERKFADLPEETRAKGIYVQVLPKHLDEEVARAMVEGFGGVMTRMTPEQAKYIGVPVEGPYKPESYKY